LARWATAWHLPPVVVFGLKHVLARPVRAFLTVLVIITGVITMTFALSAESTIQRALSDPSLFGYLPVDLMVDTGLGGDNEAMRQVLAQQAGVAGYVTNAFLSAVRDDTQTVFRVRAMGGDPTLIFPARQGRKVATVSEAMVSQALADEYGVTVGDGMTLRFGQTAVPVTVVGIYGESAGDPPTVLVLAQTITAVGVPIDVTQFGIKVAPGISHRQLGQQLGQSLGAKTGQLTPVFNLHDSLALDIIEIRGIMLALNLVLLSVVVVNLLITSSLAVRERFRDLGVMKVLRLTPGQVSCTVWVDNLALGLMALLVGIPIGLWGTQWLITAVSQQIGLDQGIARLPNGPMLLMIVPLVLLIVTIGCLLPAWRAGRMSVVAALRIE
jgi:putative ABC transport system permease protein